MLSPMSPSTLSCLSRQSSSSPHSTVTMASYRDIDRYVTIASVTKKPTTYNHLELLALNCAVLWLDWTRTV